MRDLSIDSALDFFIESLLVFIILFSPLIHGGITILPLTIIEALSFLIFFTFLAKLTLQGTISFLQSHIIWLLLFIALVIFSLIPIPENLLALLSPNTLALYKEFRITSSDIYTLSIYPEATFTMLLQLLSFFAVFFVAANYLDNPHKFRRIIFTFLIAGSIYALYGIIQNFYTPKGAFSTFTNRNHFAAYMEMIVPLCICYALTKGSKAARYLLIFMASVMGLAIFLSQSRAGAVCFSLSMLVFLTLLQVKLPSKKGLTTVIVLIIVLGLFIAAIGVGEVTKRLQTLSDPFKAMTGRIEVLNDAPRLIKDFPLFGTGLGTFIDIFQKYKTFPGEAVYRFSHNEPLQLLAESGVIGFALIFLFLLLFFKSMLTVWLKRHDPFSVYLSLGCFIGLLSISLHSFFDFMFHVPANALLFFIILALTVRVVYYKDRQAELPLPRIEFNIPEAARVVVILVICLSMILTGVLLLRRYGAESIFQRVKQTKIPETGIEAVLEYKKLLKSLDLAIALNPSNSAYPAQKANFLLEMAGRENIKDALFATGEFGDQVSILDSSESLYREALNLNPLQADHYFRLSQVYETLGKFGLANQYLQKAHMLDPQDKKIVAVGKK